ncbi:hypothetical protein D3C86_382930 [compost metagenome]
MQPALALGHGQRIVGQREVVHADVDVAGLGERRNRAPEHAHARGRVGQLVGRDAPLRLEALRQVGVGIQRDAVGPQFADLRERALERGVVLARQAVDQIDVDRFETQRARRVHEREDLRRRLDAVHGLLHGGVEVLHAEAQAVEAERGQRREALRIDRARIDLDRLLAARHEGERAAQQGHQFAQFFVVEKGRRAAAQVQLADGRTGPELRDLQRHFACEVVEVLPPALAVLRHDLVAGAVVAQRFAERDVHVQRQRLAGRVRIAPQVQRLRVVAGAEGLDEAVGRGVRGVARAGHVEAAQQLDGQHGRGLGNAGQGQAHDAVSFSDGSASSVVHALEAAAISQNTKKDTV